MGNDQLTPVSGQIFETKNRAIFLERFFGEGISGEALLVYNFVPINWLWSGFIYPRIRTFVEKSFHGLFLLDSSHHRIQFRVPDIRTISFVARRKVFWRAHGLVQGARPTQSVMYVPLQVNRFAERVLLIVQYRYLKLCSGDFYSPESDPLHKIMRYWFYYSIRLGFSFQSDRICQF